jgi:hypothetical protein
LNIFFRFFFIIYHGFPFLKRDGAGGADGQAVAQAVAVILACELSPAVDEPDSSFVAGVDAKAAAIALFTVYFYNLSDHIKCSFRDLIDKSITGHKYKFLRWNTAVDLAAVIDFVT